MTILAGDIKLVASQVMNDVDEGGGAPTSLVIADGASNSIFNDISELDRAGGRVNLRKAFVSVQTANVDGYFGANVIVADAPDDPLVSVTLFSTRQTFDERTDAKARIESYLAQGPTYAGYLFGNHITGQQSLSLLARQSVAPPVVGESYVLKKLEGTANEFEQFVRVTDVAINARTFTDSVSDFVRNEITLSISDPLRADFPGFDPMRIDTSISFIGKTRVSSTIVADAARYYGVVPLTVPVVIGDFTIQASGIFTQLVPSAQIETPIADARMNQQAAALAAGGAPVVQVLTLAFTTTQAMFIGGGILPGSLTVVRGGLTLSDQGGKLVNTADSSQVGTVDYTNGILRLSVDAFGAGGGSHTVTYTPAGTPVSVTRSIGITVTQASQRLTYVATLEPIPARESTTVSYRSQGRWYSLIEDGGGALRGGDTSVGVGTLNFSTGTLSLTLGSLPDVGSEVIIGYAPIALNPSVVSIPPPPVNIVDRAFTVFEVGATIKPGSLAISWTDGTAKTAGDAAGGITGTAAVGEVIYGSGIIRLSPNVLPASGTVFTVSGTSSVDDREAINSFTDSGANWTFSIGRAVRASSFELAIAVSVPTRLFPGIDSNHTHLLRVFDDGAGALKVTSLTSKMTIGTIDYATGACSIAKGLSGFQNVQALFQSRTPYGLPGTDGTFITAGGTEARSVALSVLNGASGLTNSPSWQWWTGAFTDTARARFAGADVAPFSFTVPLTALVVRRQLDRFKIGPHIYQRALNGVLVMDIEPTTGTGQIAGSWSSLSSPSYTFERSAA